MKTAQELALIASCIQLKRDAYPITQIVIEEVQKAFEHVVYTYGSTEINFGIGKSNLKELAVKNSIQGELLLQESHIRKYFSDLGIFITFKDIGMIEDKYIKLSLFQM